MISARDITGLVLAGGAGARVGGVDKGLLPYRGMALALYAARRLQVQVGSVFIGANRNTATYEAMGYRVVTDAVLEAGDDGEGDRGHAGPLAGMLAGLRACRSPWLAVVPCDAPLFPADLVERLARVASDAAALAAVAMAPDEEGTLRPQPTFCLLHRSLEPVLGAALQAGERKTGRWLAEVRTAAATFSGAGAFANANTLAELERLESDG